MCVPFILVCIMLLVFVQDTWRMIYNLIVYPPGYLEDTRVYNRPCYIGQFWPLVYVGSKALSLSLQIHTYICRYVSMYITNTYIYIYVHIYVSIYRLKLYVYVCTYIYTYIQTYTYIYIYTSLSIYIYYLICIHVCIYVYIYEIYIHICMGNVSVIHRRMSMQIYTHIMYMPTYTCSRVEIGYRINIPRFCWATFQQVERSTAINTHAAQFLSRRSHDVGCERRLP